MVINTTDDPASLAYNKLETAVKRISWEDFENLTMSLILSVVVSKAEILLGFGEERSRQYSTLASSLVLVDDIHQEFVSQNVSYVKRFCHFGPYYPRIQRVLFVQNRFA